MKLKEYNRFNFKKYGCYFILCIIIVTGFLVRSQYITTREFSFDESLYAWSSERIADDFSCIFTKEITEYHPPLFPLMLFIGRSIFNLPPSLLSYSFIMAIISLLAVWGAFILGARVSSCFLGIFCAFCLTFNRHYVSRSIYLLNDIPLTVLSVFLLIALRDVQQKGHWKNDLYVSIIVSMMVWIKYSGLLMIPIIVIFYLFMPKPLEYTARVRKLSLSLSLVLISIIILGIINHANRGFLTPVISSFQPFSDYFDEKTIKQCIVLAYYYIFQYTPGLLILPFIYGSLILIIEKDFFGKFLLSYIIIGFLSLLALKECDIRYGLFIVPSIFIITGIGIERTLKFLFKKKDFIFIAQASILLIILLFYLEGFQKLNNFFKITDSIIIKYSQAANFIKQRASNDTTIVTQSPRIMRYYTRINFKQFRGKITGFTCDSNKIIKDLKKMKGHVILEVNREVERQCTGFYPFSKPKKTEELLKSYGYNLSKVFYQKILFGKYLDKYDFMPAIKIFEKFDPEQYAQ